MDPKDLVNRNRCSVGISQLNLQNRYAHIWESLDTKTEIHIRKTIEEALNLADAIGTAHSGMEALITGSLHLIGGALHVMNRLYSSDLC
jgi:folylpolyglutamate synthase/dihydropteroate synthase